MARPALPPELRTRPLAVRLVEADHELLALLVEHEQSKGNAETISTLIREACRARGLTLPREVPALSDADLVLEHLTELVARDRFGLAQTPALVRAVGLPTERTWAALKELQQAGKVQLRKEDSPQLLSPADRALCPPGPRQTIIGNITIVSLRALPPLLESVTAHHGCDGASVLASGKIASSPCSPPSGLRVAPVLSCPALRAPAASLRG